MYFLLRRIEIARILLLGSYATSSRPSCSAGCIAVRPLSHCGASACRPHGRDPRPRHLPQIDGARSGALLALICYANPQAPRWLCSCWRQLSGSPSYRKDSRRRGTHWCFRKLFVVFTLAAIPVLQILPGFGTLIQATQAENQAHLVIRLRGIQLPTFSHHIWLSA